MIADKIKSLRATKDMSQTELANRLGITRSSVNAWEMGISVPSTMYIVELAHLFGVSSDYILGINHEVSLDVTGLDAEAVRIVSEMIEYMKRRR